MEAKVLSPEHGLRKEPTNKIPSSPTTARPVSTGPPSRPVTKVEKAQGRPVNTDGENCAPKRPNRRRNAFSTGTTLKHVAQKDPIAEFDRIQEGVEGIKRYFTLPTVLEPSKILVSRLRKFNKRSDEELFKAICLTDWEIEREVDKCRSAFQTVLKEIQSALRKVVEEFFLVRGPVLGEPNRNLIVVQESFRVLEDLRVTFPEAMEFGKQAGPADGGGIAAPPNSRAESQPPPPLRTQQKRARADSEEPKDLAVCVKRRKAHGIESPKRARAELQKRARADSEESQDVAVCIERDKVRETCW